MALYQITIVGTADVHRVYEVEADNHLEAGDKAWAKFENFDEPDEYTVYSNEDDVVNDVVEMNDTNTVFFDK